jgi:hypothetical protein
MPRQEIIEDLRRRELVIILRENLIFWYARA